MYKLNKSITTQEISSVKRLSDNAFIPFDPANTDYQAYLAWLDEGGVASPPDEDNNAV
jgi:hypothetical protein